MKLWKTQHTHTWWTQQWSKQKQVYHNFSHNVFRFPTHFHIFVAVRPYVRMLLMLYDIAVPHEAINSISVQIAIMWKWKNKHRVTCMYIKFSFSALNFLLSKKGIHTQHTQHTTIEWKRDRNWWNINRTQFLLNALSGTPNSMMSGGNNSNKKPAIT